MNDVEAYLAANFDSYVEELKAFCAIPSVSTDPAFANRSDAQRPSPPIACAAPASTRSRSSRPSRHPLVLGEWLGAPGAPTIVVYGHYDVQPPDPLDKWLTPPFEPTVREERLYARGASDDKGPLLIPILVAEAFLKLRGALPLNVKMLIEGEEEIGSPSFERRCRQAEGSALPATSSSRPTEPCGAPTSPPSPWRAAAWSRSM